MSTKNLLVITQKVDENDDLLGFFVGWLRIFAARFGKVFVITLAKGQYDLPANVRVYSLGKERGHNRFTRFLIFYFLLFKLAPKSSGVFAHMSPIFAIASWPAAFIFRKKIVLWYLHRQVTFRLKLAERMCYRIATAAKESLNIRSNKIVELGHGIDGQVFFTKPAGPCTSGSPIKILSVGRISEIKNYEIPIEAVKIMKDGNMPFSLKIVGRPVMRGDFDYFERLKNLVIRLDLENEVEFVGFVPYKNIPQFYRDADILVNAAPTGGIDKVVLEAIASNCLVLTSNRAFGKYFGRYADNLIFRNGNASELAEKITHLCRQPAKVLGKMKNLLRGTVVREHDLNNLIKKIYQLYD